MVLYVVVLLTLLFVSVGEQQHIQQQAGVAAADHPVGEGIPEELTAPKPDAGKLPPPTHSVQHLALSPGLDASVLRQVRSDQLLYVYILLFIMSCGDHFYCMVTWCV